MPKQVGPEELVRLREQSQRRAEARKRKAKRENRRSAVETARQVIVGGSKLVVYLYAALYVPQTP